MTASLPPNKIAFLAAALLLVGCAEPAPQGQLWGYYEPPRNTLELFPSPISTFAFYRARTGRGNELWIAKRTNSNFKNGAWTRDDFWTSSETCPNLLKVVAEVRALRDYDDKAAGMSSDTLPGKIKVEGGSPNLKADPPFQKLDWDREGPLPAWKASAEEKLQGCWSKQPPRTPGH